MNDTTIAIVEEIQDVVFAEVKQQVKRQLTDKIQDCIGDPVGFQTRYNIEGLDERWRHVQDQIWDQVHKSYSVFRRLS